MDEEYFLEYLDKNPDFSEKMTGFIHYDNEMTAGTKTMIALPIFYTGKPFTRNDTYGEYLDKIYSENNVITSAYQNKYNINIFSEELFFSNSIAEYVDNFVLTNQSVGINKTLLKKLYKVTLYRYLPMIFKPYFFFDTSEFYEINKNDEKYIINDPQFFVDLRNKGITTESKKRLL